MIKRVVCLAGTWYSLGRAGHLMCQVKNPVTKYLSELQCMAMQCNGFVGSTFNFPSEVLSFIPPPLRSVRVRSFFSSHLVSRSAPLVFRPPLIQKMDASRGQILYQSRRRRRDRRDVLLLRACNFAVSWFLCIAVPPPPKLFARRSECCLFFY